MSKTNCMFDSYDAKVTGSFDTTSTFPPKCPNEKLDPCKPKIPYEEYNAEGKLVGYYWYYGDTTTLEFNLEGEVTVVDQGLYSSVEDFMQGKSVSIMFYDFRNNLIYQKDYSIDDVKASPTKIIFEIDDELSKTLFVRGVYYCSFVIWDGQGLNKTLFSQEDATFIVK